MRHSRPCSRCQSTTSSPTTTSVPTTHVPTTSAPTATPLPTDCRKDTCATATETYFEILRLRSADTLTESDLFRDLLDILFEDWSNDSCISLLLKLAKQDEIKIPEAALCLMMGGGKNETAHQHWVEEMTKAIETERARFISLSEEASA